VAEVISFEEAIQRTEGDLSLLIGNGFSAEYFNYATLLNASGLPDDDPVRKLFAQLQTNDFEKAVRSLETAALVENAYGEEARAECLEADAQRVREALVTAINTTHPAHRDQLKDRFASSAVFLAHFDRVFSLNYDLLLYWVNLEKAHLSDGFGLGERTGQFLGPFREDAYCHIYNLHGGLHLFDNGLGEIIKAVDEGDGVIATIGKTIRDKRKMPVYVAEGTSAQKVRKINSVPYLRHCLDQLRQTTSTLFVYGHSADENDAHIYSAIFTPEVKHLYFGVWEPTEEKIRAMDGQLAKYQKVAGAGTDYTFFDSASARVWEA